MLICKRDHRFHQRASNGQCPECKRISARKYYEANAENIRKRAREINRADPEPARKRAREWAQNNPERVAAQKRDDWMRKPLGFERKRSAQRRANGYKSEWRRKYPLRAKANDIKRKARRKQADGSFTAQDVRNLFATQSGRCLCGERLKKYHIDHVMPLSRGGSNYSENLQLLCAPCNLSKGVKTMSEWSGPYG